jgi:1L-myo-inositol 1-phosphate cytidylyltransferase / CDP-L-myo-inositol myo-inositolphosphotransferase
VQPRGADTARSAATAEVRHVGVRCVVLAAGRGSRLGRSRPKPLEPVLGLTLLERVVVGAAMVGVDEFFVVTGYEAERVEAFLADLALRRSMRIVPVRNEAWPLGNGTSALAARAVVDAQFMLVMGDHIFDEQVLRRLLEQPIEPGGVVVGADFRVGDHAIANDADATKLLIEGERVLDIGKSLTRYNAYDTGAFLCHPAIFDALEASAANQDGSLSAGVGWLAREGHVRAFDIGVADWVDVDTAADARRARARLRATMTKPEDGFVARVVNRRLSGRVLTPMLLRLWPRVTANEVSLLGFAVALLAAGFFLVEWPVAAGAMVALASILDGSDGEIARLKQQRSPFGAYLDAVLDRYADTAMLVAAAVFAWRAAGHWAVVAVGVAATAGNLMVSYTSARSVVDLGYRYRSRWLAAGRGRDLRLFVLSVAAVLAAVTPVAVLGALVVVAVITNGIVAARLVLSWRLGRSSPVTDIDAVVFDLDGTVADTMPFLTDLAVGLLGRYGLSRNEARRRYLDTVGLDFAGQLEELLPAHPANSAVAAEFETRKQEGFLRCPVFPDTYATLTFLDGADVRRFVSSSTTRELVAAFLCRHRIETAFDDYTGFEPGCPKDRQVELLISRHELAPDRVLFVGDSPRDAQLLRRVGVRFVGVQRLFSRHEFRRRGLHSVRDLAALTRLWRGDARRRLDQVELADPRPTRPTNAGREPQHGAQTAKGR